MGLKIIITGTTGMVGEGVLFECLQNDKVSQVLSISRRSYEISHPKYSQLIVPDFRKIGEYREQLKGFDGCFFCAGVSSVGMKEEKYTGITYTTTLEFAKVLAEINPGMVFNFVSGASTDSSEKGRMMWARVKGRTENALMKLPFRGQYNFRPGVMKPFKGQKNVRWFFRLLVPVFFFLFRRQSLTMEQVGRAMIQTVTDGYNKQILEIKDIKKLGS